MIIKTKKAEYSITKMSNGWITVKRHHDDEEETGRHLFIRSGETPKDAMKRQWGVDLDKRKQEKEAKAKNPSESQPKQAEPKQTIQPADNPEVSKVDKHQQKIDEAQKKVDDLNQSLEEAKKNTNEAYEKAVAKENNIKERIAQELAENKEYQELKEKDNGFGTFAEKFKYSERMKEIRDEIIAKYLDERADNDKKYLEVKNKQEEIEKQYISAKNEVDLLKYDKYQFNEGQKKSYDNQHDVFNSLMDNEINKNPRIKKVMETEGRGDYYYSTGQINRRRQQRDFKEQLKHLVLNSEEYKKANEEFESKVSIEDEEKRLSSMNDCLKELEDLRGQYEGEISESGNYNLVEDRKRLHDLIISIGSDADILEAHLNRRKRKEQAKTNYHPQTVANVSRGQEMSFDEANSGSVNPLYGTTEGRNNCQSCVVDFELRLRGYNVEVLPNEKGSKLEKLSANSNEAWIDPETGEYAEPMLQEYSSFSSFDKFLEKNIKDGERYNMVVHWKGLKYGHVVTMFRKNGSIRIYDPQTSSTIPKIWQKSWNEYFEDVSFTEGYRPKVYRVDDKAFNPEYYNDIVKGV